MDANVILINSSGRLIWWTLSNSDAGHCVHSGRPVSVLTVCLGSSVCLWIPVDLYKEVWAFKTAAFSFSAGSFWRSETSIAAISSGVSCSELKREGVESRWKQRQLFKYPWGKGILEMAGKNIIRPSLNQGNSGNIWDCWKVKFAAVETKRR